MFLSVLIRHFKIRLVIFFCYFQKNDFSVIAIENQNFVNAFPR